MKSPLVRCVGMISWAITAIASIHVGMQAVGHDLFMRFGLENNPMINMYAQYITGIAGVASLIMLVMALACKRCCCGESCSKGSCNTNPGAAGYCSRCGCAPCKCK